LLAGSTYSWEIDNAAGAAGTNWDLLNVTGELNLSTLTTANGGKLNLVLQSLSGFTLADSANKSYVFATAASINGSAFDGNGFVTDYFNINTTAFNGGVLPNNYFKVEVGTTGSGLSALRTLSLVTIPEPSAPALMGLGLAALIAVRSIRRR
jgi:hypothetical protein